MASAVWPPRRSGIRGFRFPAEAILWAVRWYLRFPVSYRDLEAMLADRGVAVDHVSLYRWVQRLAPELEKRLRRHLRPCPGPWHVDETFVQVGGGWRYLYRAVDRTGPMLGFESFRTARRALAGVEAMSMLAKGQVRVVPRDDMPAQRAFVHQAFGLAA